jgi:hypothetical protein
VAEMNPRYVALRNLLTWTVMSITSMQFPCTHYAKWRGFSFQSTVCVACANFLLNTFVHLQWTQFVTLIDGCSRIPFHWSIGCLHLRRAILLWTLWRTSGCYRLQFTNWGVDTKVRTTNRLLDFLLQWFFGPVLLLDANCLQFSSLLSSGWSIGCKLFAIQ